MIKTELTHETQYAGFVKDKEIGADCIIFETFVGELLCRLRTAERMRQKENYEQFDVSRIMVKKRDVVTNYGDWVPINEE